MGDCDLDLDHGSSRDSLLSADGAHRSLAVVPEHTKDAIAVD
jgi:hypothetical protein